MVETPFYLRVYYIEFKLLHLESVHFSCVPECISQSSFIITYPTYFHAFHTQVVKIKFVLLVKAAFFSWSLYTHCYSCLNSFFT